MLCSFIIIEIEFIIRFVFIHLGHCRLCQLQQSTQCCSNSTDSGTRFLVVGAISYPGYMVSEVLMNKGVDLKIVEDTSSLGFDMGTWKNYDMLKKINLIPSIIDFTTDSKLRISHLEWLKNGGTVVYIPSLLYNAIHENSSFDVKFITSMLKGFTSFLEEIRNYNKIKVVFIVPKGENLFSSQHSTAIRIFSSILSAYQTAYKTRMSFISFNVTKCDAPHNLLCCNHEELTKVLTRTLLDRGTTTCSELQLQCSGQFQSDSLYFSSERRDVITSTHFTGGRSKFKKDSFAFMKGFFMTAVHLNLQILIFHDGLGTNFQKNLKSFYDRTEIVKIKGLNGRSMNDGRFYILYDYLLNHPEVRSIALQDIRDGIFVGNPFNVMDAIGDVLYMGMDRSFYVSAYDHFWLRKRLYPNCHQNELTRDAVHYHPFYNAGTIGGTRDVMLTFLTRLIKYFDKSPHHLNCNMATVSVVVHNHFFDHSYSGYPFQGYMETGIGIPRGLAIRHKDTQYV